jgi:hypothetical protein
MQVREGSWLGEGAREDSWLGERCRWVEAGNRGCALLLLPFTRPLTPQVCASQA